MLAGWDERTRPVNRPSSTSQASATSSPALIHALTINADNKDETAGFIYLRERKRPLVGGEMVEGGGGERERMCVRV